VNAFEIITESDARVLPPGATVLLKRGGHITPLAQDTLRERRIIVVREGSVTDDEATLVPVADIRKVAVGSDHAGVALRKAVIAFLRARGLAVDDLGTNSTEPVDYPDVAAAVADAVARREADAGIVIDGGGMGSAIAANKVDGFRAVMATTETIARYAREHVGANVLALGASLTTEEEAKVIIATWLTTSMREPRYIRRLVKLQELERRSRDRSA